MPEVVFDYQTESRRVEEALRAVFPQDTIATDEGYNGRVHVKVVSERFNHRSEHEKQVMILDILRDKLGADAQAVSLAMAYSTDVLSGDVEATKRRTTVPGRSGGSGSR